MSNAMRFPKNGQNKQLMRGHRVHAATILASSSSNSSTNDPEGRPGCDSEDIVPLSINSRAVDVNMRAGVMR